MADLGALVHPLLKPSAFDATERKKELLMYRLIVFSVLALSIFSSHRGRADERPQEEIEINKIFFPQTGYDDNDNIQVMVEGDLPDPCYVLGKQSIDHDPISRKITVHQYAWRRNTDICNSGDLLGESPFSEEVSLGKLKSGDYVVNSRKLHVETARMSATDNLNYAQISGLGMPDFLPPNRHAMLKISGTFLTPCSHLRLPIAVQKQGDVFVILPEEVNPGTCGHWPTYFEQEIDLGVLPGGEYLVHIRSKNGRVVEKTLRVFKEAA
jgi:hypothetical protein